MILELTFGGASAPAYEILSNRMKHKYNTYVGTPKRKTHIITESKNSKYVKPLLISDKATIISYSDIDLLTKKISRLGKHKAALLLSKFGSVEGIKNATPMELHRIDGIGATLVNRIINNL